MGLLWGLIKISMVFLKDFFGNSNGIHEVSLGFQWWFYDISMGFLLGSCEISMVFLWYFYGISSGFLCKFYGGSLEFLWDFKRVSMGFPLDFYQISM